MENCQLKGAHEVHTGLILQRQELNPKREVRPWPLAPLGARCTGKGRWSGTRCSRGVSADSHLIRKVLSLSPVSQRESEAWNVAVTYLRSRRSQVAELGFEPLQPGSRVQVLFKPFYSPSTHYPEALSVPPSTSLQSHLHLLSASLLPAAGPAGHPALLPLWGHGPFETRTRLWAT